MGLLIDFEQLAMDVRICKDMGIGEVILFLMTGNYGLFGAYDYEDYEALDELIDYVEQEEPLSIQYDRTVTVEHKLMNMIDLKI